MRPARASTTARAPYVGTALGISVATGIYGISFGVLGVTAGLTVLQTCATSLLMFTGGSQFALVSVLAAGGSPVTGATNAWLLGARNAAYGFAMAPLLRRERPGRRLIGSHLVIDESTAMARAQVDEADARGAFWLTGVALFLCWNAGTLGGALVGSGLGDPARFGLDAMFPAAFLALLAPQLRQPGAVRAAALGMLIAAALIPLTPPGVPVLAAGLAVLVSVKVTSSTAAADDRPLPPGDPTP